MPANLPELFAARRARLATWIATHYGRKSDFQALTGINHGLLSALLSETTSKSFGEKIAIEIETLAAKVSGKPAMPDDYLLYPFPRPHSQAERLDHRILAQALDAAALAKGGLSAERLAAAYELALTKRRQAEVVSISPPAKPIGKDNGTHTGRNRGTVPDPRRTLGTRKK